jgi:mercuric ion transport protein
MNRTGRAADSAGVLGAVLAALCCAGVPFIVTGLAALGLSSLRNDALLMPLMGVSLAVALWGFLIGRRLHHSSAPVATAIAGSAALVAGVVYVHGAPAKALIGLGAAALIVATAANIRLRRACARSIHSA